MADSSLVGTFIVFEGGEGSGKSTQAQRLAEKRGALLSREPGGTDVGAKIRKLLLDPGSAEVSPRAEALLMAADRAHHVATKIRPALESGTDVVLDRYMGSSMAYQGVGRGLGIERIRDLSLFAVDGLVPSLVVLLDVPVEVGRVRAGERGAPDKIEQETAEFHEMIRRAFLSIAEAESDTWVVLDGTEPEDVISKQIDDIVAERFGW